MRISALFVTAFVLTQAQPPDTEVFLAKLAIAAGKITVSGVENISNHPGYDNQPSFTPDGKALFFTSARGGQMDIYRYDTATKSVAAVTMTSESEYSATLMPDGRHISVIRVEADKTQRLWKFPLSGGEPSLVFTDVKPVGYHAWLDKNLVAMFVLGEPATLQVGDIRSGKAEIVAKDIGRSLMSVPGGGVSFVQRAGQGTERTMTISLLTVKKGVSSTSALTPVAPGATEEFVCWMPDRTLLMSGGGKLYSWRQGDAAWREVADLTAFGLRNVSRLAVSPRGNSLALVAAR
jgi:WD40 repeat protein